MVHVLIESEEGCDLTHSMIDIPHEEYATFGSELLGSEESQSIKLHSDGEFLQEAINLHSRLSVVSILGVDVSFRKVEFFQFCVDVYMVGGFLSEVDARLVYFKFGIRGN